MNTRLQGEASLNRGFTLCVARLGTQRDESIKLEEDEVKNGKENKMG
jgi:hypothetical protein